MLRLLPKRVTRDCPEHKTAMLLLSEVQLKRRLFHKMLCLILMTNFNSNYCERRSVRINILNGSFCVGWPRLQWFVTEHLGKPPKDWLPPPRQSDEAPAYVEVRTLSFHVKIASRSDRCVYMCVRGNAYRKNGIGSKYDMQKRLF